jgi:hypothetical protein
MLQRLHSNILNFDLIVKVIYAISSNCIEVRDQALLVLGHLIRNGLDIGSLIFENDALELILQ